jgi:hypothetical protein
METAGKGKRAAGRIFADHPIGQCDIHCELFGWREVDEIRQLDIPRKIGAGTVGERDRGVTALLDRALVFLITPDTEAVGKIVADWRIVAAIPVCQLQACAEVPVLQGRCLGRQPEGYVYHDLAVRVFLGLSQRAIKAGMAWSAGQVSGQGVCDRDLR